jgi:hypothetical protein
MTNKRIEEGLKKLFMYAKSNKSSTFNTRDVNEPDLIGFFEGKQESFKPTIISLKLRK